MNHEKLIISKIPANIEELKRLKALKKAIKKTTDIEQQKNIQQAVQPKVLERVFQKVPGQKPLENVIGDIRIMTFNVLAQSLIKRELFPESGDFLRWKLRRKMILEEIQLYNPDILTMQELDNFNEFYKNEFQKLGYDVKYFSHPMKKHGCGIAYKKEKFTVVGYDTVDYDQDALCPPSSITGNIAQLLALQSKLNPEVGFVVGNTHLYWKPAWNYERFRQVLIYSQRFRQFKLSQSDNNVKRWIPLLLGDFNTTPDDPAYSILTKKCLSDAEIEDLQTSLEQIIAHIQNEEEEENDKKSEKSTPLTRKDLLGARQLVDLFKDGYECTSIYSNYEALSSNPKSDCFGMNGEPKFTNYASQFQGILDYIFIEKQNTTPTLFIKNILMLPEESFFKPHLPNLHFGSDHLCLVADLQF